MVAAILKPVLIACAISAAIAISAIVAAEMDPPHDPSPERLERTARADRMASAQLAVMWTDYLNQQGPQNLVLAPGFHDLSSVLDRHGIPHPTNDDAILRRLGQVDRFGNAFLVTDDPRSGITVLSAGPDGQPGTTDDCRDPHQEYRRNRS